MRDAHYYGSREEFDELRSAWTTATKELAKFRSRMENKYGESNEFRQPRTKAEKLKGQLVDAHDYKAMGAFVDFMLRWYPVKLWKSTVFLEILAVTFEDIRKYRGYN